MCCIPMVTIAVIIILVTIRVKEIINASSGR
jgi:hypothetical protein